MRLAVNRMRLDILRDQLSTLNGLTLGRRMTPEEKIRFTDLTTRIDELERILSKIDHSHRRKK